MHNQLVFNNPVSNLLHLASKGHFKRVAIKNSTFFIKLFNWEYWPMSITNIPVGLIYLWFAIRARNPFFFTTVNPVIETGGLFGESKINILNRIPKKVLPITVFVKKETDFQAIVLKLNVAKLSYPIIAKPDVGERGTLVSKIKSEQELKAYWNKNKIDFLIQEFVGLPLEWAVMNHRFPNSKVGKITSICVKEPLKVVGDGFSSVRELMDDYPRARFQLERFEKEFPNILTQIPKNEEVILLEPIGNHCRGTMFLNGNDLIDEELTASFNEVAFQMADIFYGRFDIKCASLEAAKKGEFKILEYNGVGAEPAHIYDPSYPLLKKYRDVYRHWKIIYKIYKIQKKKGVKPMTLRAVFESFKVYKKYMASLKRAF